jgi:hypothetical protein
MSRSPLLADAALHCGEELIGCLKNMLPDAGRSVCQDIRAHLLGSG